MQTIIINGERWDVIPPSGAIRYYRYRDPMTGQVFNHKDAWSVAMRRDGSGKDVPRDVRYLVSNGWQFIRVDSKISFGGMRTHYSWRSPHDGGMYTQEQALEAQEEAEAKAKAKAEERQRNLDWMRRAV